MTTSSCFAASLAVGLALLAGGAKAHTPPFIDYRNMALWGLLPLTIAGRTFDEDTIRDVRQVFELKAREIADRRPSFMP